MKIDEITRNSFLSPLMAIQDIPAFDDDGEFQLDESDFWNIYNPDEMNNIPEEERETLQYWREAVRKEGEQFRQDTEKFLATVPDEDTLKAGADMLHSLDSFTGMYSGLIQHSESLEEISTLEQTIAELEQTIAELEPLAKEHPVLLSTIERLKTERDRLKAERNKLKDKLDKPRYGEIREAFKRYRDYYRRINNKECPYSERTFENWCKGSYTPRGFPVDKWYISEELIKFVHQDDREERREAGALIHGMTEEEMHRKKKR